MCGERIILYVRVPNIKTRLTTISARLLQSAFIFLPFLCVNFVLFTQTIQIIDQFRF